MTKKKKDIQYCVECGVENKPLDKRCIKCKKELDPKDHGLKDYLKSKAESKVEDKLWSSVKEYIKSHLYGTILTCSLLVTSASVIINVVLDNSYIEKVKEKPQEASIVYVGEGLTSEEVVRKYIEAMKSGDESTIEGLKLETFHNDVREYLKTYEYEISGYILDGPITEYAMGDLKSKYFDNIQGDYTIARSYEMVSEGTYGEYKFERWAFAVEYCGYNDCHTELPTWEQDYFYLRKAIETIEVDGRIYINGEANYVMSVREWISHQAVIKFEGDTSKFSFKEILEKSEEEICEEYDICTENYQY